MSGELHFLSPSEWIIRRKPRLWSVRWSGGLSCRDYGCTKWSTSRSNRLWERRRDWGSGRGYVHSCSRQGLGRLNIMRRIRSAQKGIHWMVKWMKRWSTKWAKSRVVIYDGQLTVLLAHYNCDFIGSSSKGKIRKMICSLNCVQTVCCIYYRPDLAREG